MFMVIIDSKTRLRGVHNSLHLFLRLVITFLALHHASLAGWWLRHHRRRDIYLYHREINIASRWLLVCACARDISLSAKNSPHRYPLSWAARCGAVSRICIAYRSAWWRRASSGSITGISVRRGVERVRHRDRMKLAGVAAAKNKRSP